MRWINTARGEGFGREFLDLLVGELLLARSRPGLTFYLISPWIQREEMSFHQMGYLSDLFPFQTSLNLVDVLQHMLRAGISLNIAVRYPRYPNRPTQPELETLSVVRRLWQTGHEQLKIHLFKDLHTKLYVGDMAAVAGSANATRGGLVTNKELLYYTAAPEEIRDLRTQAEATITSNEHRVNLSALWEGQA